jgi:pimeloyl-ACP methyl ester carboxylesterase
VAVDQIAKRLADPKVFSEFTWEQYLEIERPYPVTDFSCTDVTTRFNRNGYDWDVHGLLYRPAREVEKGLAVVIIHGGAGSSRGKDTTPDGRPGVARVLAGQGFTVLSVDYVGHYAPGAIWTKPIAERQPIYLLDRELPVAETLDRNLKCTFNVNMQGIGQLVDQNLAGHRVLAFGHSTGGPMVFDLYAFSKKTTTIGLIGFGSGGPQCWRPEWLRVTNQKIRDQPIDAVSRRSVESFREQGYEGLPELAPWGRAEEFIRWAFYARSQIKTGLSDNQLQCAEARLEEYVAVTGLPREEYFDYLEPQDPDWLRTLGVILLCSENDRIHWHFGERVEDKYDVFMGRKYAEYTPRSKVMYIPKYTHYGIMELHNEKIVYLWLWAHKLGFFGATAVRQK